MDNKEKKQRQEERARAKARQRVEQDVVYTQPKPFNRNRFFLQLATVVAVVLAVLFGMSIFFKVRDVQVAGNVKYDAWTIREASGIMDGENLLTLSKAKIASNIEDKLTYADDIRIGIKLPDTVVIQIKELEVVYSAQDQTGSWWLLNSRGRVVDTCDKADAEKYTKIVGVLLESPVVGENAVAHELSTETDPLVLEKERLATAVTIMQELENAGFIGSMASIDVSKMTELELWYDNTRFQILLGDDSNLEKKLSDLHTVIEKQFTEKDTGILDIRDGKVKHNLFS